MNSFKILCCAGSFVGFSFMSAAGWLVAQDAPKSDVPPAVTEAVTEEPEASKSESKTAGNPTTSTSITQEKQEAPSTDSNETQEESLKRATPDETQPASKEMPAESDVKSAVSQEDGTPGKIRFRFDEIEWAEVIDWFAEQNGFSLFPIVQPPEGTFKYFDDQEYTVLEGLDQLNHALALQGGYTLIRNRKMLVLTKKSEGYPSELIEEIDPTELEDRGKYEIVRCIFDINGLEETDFASEVEDIISRDHRDGYAVFDSSKKMMVRETGEKLRRINEMLDVAKKIAITGNLKYQTYDMQNVEPETLLFNVRELMGMREDENQMRDETLVFSVEPPPGNRVFLKGTPKRIEEFQNIAKLIDVPLTAEDGAMLEKPFLETYTIRGTPEVMFQVMQTMFEGEEVRMDQDETTGNIILLGRTEHHDRMVAYLKELNDTGEGFAAIQLQYETPEDIILKLMALFRVNPDEPTTSGPAFYADAIKDQILVSGTPQEIQQVKDMVATLDTGDDLMSGPRTNQRFLEMTPYEADRIMSMLPDLMPTTGRQNKLNLVLPENRASFRDRLRRRGADGPQQGDEIDAMLRELDALQDSSPAQPAPKSENTDGNTSVIIRSVGSYVALGPQDDESQVGNSPQQDPANGYKPAEDFNTIPGSDLTAKQTEYGIVLSSDDLDALDDTTSMILDMLSSTTSPELPTIFYLNHRSAVEAKSLLDALLGLADGGGGGGGGGLGGMMGGMLGNAIGGGAGDALSGLFGGGMGLGGTSSGVILEGDVQIGTDVKFNTLIVTGATSMDLDTISELIDYVDAPEPPPMDLLGKTFYIPVIHRDPTELLERAKTQFSDLIKKEETGGGNSAEMKQAQQMMKAMQQLTGGKGGGGSDPEQEKPSATIGVDESTSMILVTGPEFIYLKVLDLVERLDVPDTSSEKRRMITTEGKKAEVIARTLAAMLGEKGELVIGGEAVTPGTSSAKSSSNSSSTARNSGGGDSKAAAEQREAVRNAFMKAMQQRAAAGGGRGGSSGGRGGGRGK